MWEFSSRWKLEPLRQNEFFWAFTPASILSSNLAGFLTIVPTHVDIFVPFKQVWSFCFLCTTAAFCDVCVRFFCFIFKIEFNALLDLLNTGIIIIEIGLFCGGNTGSKNLQIRGFYWQDGDVYLIEECFCLTGVWKYFKYWLSSSSSSFNYLTCFPKDGWVNLKQGKFSFTVWVPAFDKFHWMPRYLFATKHYPVCVNFQKFYFFKKSFFFFLSCTAFCDFYFILFEYAFLFIDLFILRILICRNFCLKFSSCRHESLRAMQRTQIAF